MTGLPRKSFSEVAVVEAVARLASVWLVVRPLRPGPERRLSSRFLGIDKGGRLILAVPTTGDTTAEKVFLPVGCDVGMIFSVGGLLLQVVTRVLDHCHYRQFRDRRVEALAVQRPSHVTELSHRKNLRWEVDVGEQITASIWPVEGLCSAAPPPPRIGRLVNWSDSGLGVCLAELIPHQLGTAMVIRL